MAVLFTSRQTINLKDRTIGIPDLRIVSGRHNGPTRKPHTQRGKNGGGQKKAIPGDMDTDFPKSHFDSKNNLAGFHHCFSLEKRKKKAGLKRDGKKTRCPRNNTLPAWLFRVGYCCQLSGTTRQ